jgi:hypothetical protein
MSPISDDSLRKAALDVAYEFKLFREAYKRYRSPDLPAPVPPIIPELSLSRGHNDSTINMPLTLSANTATLSPQSMAHLDRDALLIHFRVLMDFFYGGEEKRKDDIRAHHYTRGAPRNAPTWHVEFREKCNKLFAHLTYSRTAYRIRDGHHWYDIPEKVMDMEAEITGFLMSLTPERMAWFEVIDG